MATYSRGDHLRVGRLPIAGRFLYYHHGIYIGDDRVVQFGVSSGTSLAQASTRSRWSASVSVGCPKFLVTPTCAFQAECHCLLPTRQNGSLRGRAALSRPSLAVFTT